MKNGFILFLAGICFCTQAQPKNFQVFYNKAKEAYKAKDYPAFYQSMSEAHRIHPYHQVLLYNHGIASALTNKPEEAVQFLRKAILINAEFDLTNPDLASLQPRSDFQEVVKLKMNLTTPVIHSSIAFTLTDRQLHIEGITYDPRTKSFFVGSVHKRKVVKINPDGSVSDFTQPGQDGMASVFGLKVDSKKNLLWACTSPIPEMQDYDSTLSSLVFKFNLATGTLLATYASEVKKSNFGDLVLDKQGDVFVSDSRNNIIFRVNEKSHKLEPFFESPEFWSIQGITFSDDAKTLFISDYIKGLFRLDVKTKQLSPITCHLDVSLKGIDGLTFYRNSLIAIQNGVNPLRAVRYFLSKDGNEIVASEVIDHKHPQFNEPTLGTLAGKSFYYIANSQWSGYIKGKIKPPEELQDIVILKATLD